MDNNINFKGAFLVKNPTHELKSNIGNILKSENKGKQIINNVCGKGDVLYIVKEDLDNNIAEVLIKSLNTKFKYYPGLEKISGFSVKNAVDAKKLLRSAAHSVISAKYKLLDFLRMKPKFPVDLNKLFEINKRAIAKKTFIDVSGSNFTSNINPNTGVCSVYTMVENPRNRKELIKKEIISVTPPDKSGISYARVVPAKNESSTFGMRRLAIKNGNVIFEYNEPASKNFIKNESAAKEHYISVIEKYNEALNNYSNKFFEKDKNLLIS